MINTWEDFGSAFLLDDDLQLLEFRGHEHCASPTRHNMDGSCWWTTVDKAQIVWYNLFNWVIA